MDLHRPTLQSPGLQCTPTPAAVSRQPGVNAAARKAQRLDHRFWALARLHSFHRTNPNLLQRLMFEGTSVASFHALHCTLCLLTYERINNPRKRGGVDLSSSAKTYRHRTYRPIQSTRRTSAAIRVFYLPRECIRLFLRLVADTSTARKIFGVST